MSATILSFVPMSGLPHTTALYRCGACGRIAIHVFLSRLRREELQCSGCWRVGTLGPVIDA